MSFPCEKPFYQAEIKNRRSFGKGVEMRALNRCDQERTDSQNRSQGRDKTRKKNVKGIVFPLP